jgi:hypothetical protein
MAETKVVAQITNTTTAATTVPISTTTIAIISTATGTSSFTIATIALEQHVLDPNAG